MKNTKNTFTTQASAIFVCIWFFSGPIAAIAQTSATDASTLNLQTYVGQVLEKNKSLEAAKLASDGAQLYREEGDLVFRPRLFSELSLKDDKRQTVNPNFQGNRTESKNGRIGIENSFGFGLFSRLSYVVNQSEITGLSPLLFTGGVLNNANGGLNLELVQPLWKGGFGRELWANSQLAESSADASFYAERQKAKSIAAQAEVLFARLALTQMTEQLQTELLDRARRIESWAAQRANKNLGDLSDALQAKAATQQRELELTSVKEDLRAAAQSFNTFRGRDSDRVLEKLEFNPDKDLSTIQSEQVESDELNAIRANLKSLEANATLAKERWKPALDIFANAGTNGVDTSTSEAIQRSLKGNYNYYEVGLRFSLPLSVSEASDVRYGREKQILAAEADLIQKTKEDQDKLIDWKNKLQLSIQKLSLIKNLVEVQKKKLNREKEKLNFGRSTTYQVLVFEQDYAQAQLLNVRTLAEAYAALAQVKIYSKQNKETEN